MSIFKVYMETIIKVHSMSDEALLKRKQELINEINVLDEMGISNSKLSFEAMIIISRLVEEGKMDYGITQNDLDNSVEE